MERRPIIIKNIEEARLNQTAVDAKIVKNTTQGAEMYLRSGVRPFTGYSESALSAQFNTIIELCDVSQQEVIQRIAAPLEKIARELGIQAIFTGRDDLPPHITLQPVNLKNFDNGDLSETLDRLEVDRNIGRVSTVLAGRTFLLDTLVIGENIYLCTSTASSEAYKARKILRRIVTGKRSSSVDRYIEGAIQVKEVSSEPTISPIDFDDIVHITVGRLKKEATLEQLKSFYEQVLRLQADLHVNPIQVISTGLYAGSSLGFFQKYAPHLITKK